MRSSNVRPFKISRLQLIIRLYKASKIALSNLSSSKWLTLNRAVLQSTMAPLAHHKDQNRTLNQT